MNIRAIRALVKCARTANHMATHYARMGMDAKAHEWRQLCRAHMAGARALKGDDQ